MDAAIGDGDYTYRVVRDWVRHLDGRRIARITTVPAAGEGPGQFYSPHGLAIDSRGDLYVGEVSYTAWPSLHPDQPLPPLLRTLHKLERVAGRT